MGECGDEWGIVVINWKLCYVVVFDEFDFGMEKLKCEGRKVGVGYCVKGFVNFVLNDWEVCCNMCNFGWFEVYEIDFLKCFMWIGFIFDIFFYYYSSKRE